MVMLSPPNQGSELAQKLKDVKLYKALYGEAGQEIGTDRESLPQQLGPVPLEIGVIAGDRSNKMAVVFDGGGRFANWAVDVNAQHNKTYLVFDVVDPKEQTGCKAFDLDVLQRASQPEWWPERVTLGRDAPSMEVLEENYNPLMKPGTPKKHGGGFYEPKVKCGVTVHDETGEPAKWIRIKDAAGNPVSLHELPGRKWKRIVVGLHYVYFKGSNEFGVVKKLEYVQLAEDDEGGSNNPDMFDDLQYLEDDQDAELPAAAPAAADPLDAGVDEAAAAPEAHAAVEEPPKKRAKKGKKSF